MNNKLIKILFNIGFVLIFFPVFCIFFVPNTRAYIGIGTIVWLMLYSYCFIQNPKRFAKFITVIFKYKIFKAYFLFMFYIVFSMIIHISLGHYRANIGHYVGRITDFLIPSIAMYLFPTLSLYLRVSLKQIIKLLYFGIFTVLIIGIVQYIGIVLDVDFIQKILDIFSNLRLYLYKINPTSYHDLQRVHSILPEPSDLGKFIFILMPFGIELFVSKNNLFKNKIWSLITKYSLLPLMIFILVITKSPIYLILCFIELGILLFIYNLKRIRNHIVIFFIITIISIFFVTILYSSQTFKESKQYERINSTFNHITNFHELTVFSSSLACRIVSYRTHVEIWKLYPIFGVGLDNEGSYAKDLFNKLNYPLTNENILTYNAHPTVWGLNESVIWSTLSNLGLLGLFLLANFIYKNIISIKTIINKSNGIYKSFFKALFLSLIMISIISFYNLVLTSYQLWLILGLILAVSLHYKQIRVVKIISVNHNNKLIKGDDNEYIN